jgi:hypothetical protein
MQGDEEGKNVLHVGLNRVAAKKVDVSWYRVKIVDNTSKKELSTCIKLGSYSQ